MTRPLLSGLVVALLCAACGNSQSTTSPSTTATVQSRITEIFAGNLTAQDSQFYSFTVTQAGTTDITLVSLRPAGASTPAPAATTVHLGNTGVMFLAAAPSTTPPPSSGSLTNPTS